MEDLLFEINETARAVRRLFDQRASAMGVTRSQWRVLARLKREPGLRQVELAERLDMEPITLCRIVDRLEEAGLVERQTDPSDRRAWLLELTAKADPVVKQLRGLARSIAEEAMNGIKQGELRELQERLAAIRSNVARACEQRGKAVRGGMRSRPKRPTARRRPKKLPRKPLRLPRKRGRLESRSVRGFAPS
jgi:MarR family transcriptional regulator for hemolysin